MLLPPEGKSFCIKFFYVVIGIQNFSFIIFFCYPEDINAYFYFPLTTESFEKSFIEAINSEKNITILNSYFKRLNTSANIYASCRPTHTLGSGLYFTSMRFFGHFARSIGSWSNLEFLFSCYAFEHC